MAQPPLPQEAQQEPQGMTLVHFYLTPPRETLVCVLSLVLPFEFCFSGASPSLAQPKK